MELPVRKEKQSLTLINSSNSALTVLWGFKLLNLSFLASQEHTITYNVFLRKRWLPILSSRVNMAKMNWRKYQFRFQIEFIQPCPAEAQGGWPGHSPGTCSVSPWGKGRCQTDPELSSQCWQGSGCAGLYLTLCY